MATQIRIKEEINTIQHDANRVFRDISRLSSRLGAAGLEAVESGSDQLAGTMQMRLADLRSRIADINGAMKEYGGRAGQTVRSHPYAFACGALGIGYLLGKLPFGAMRSTPD